MTDEDLQRWLALDGAPGPAQAIQAAHADAIVDAALAGAGFGPGGGGDGNGGGDGGHHTAGNGAGTGAAHGARVGGAASGAKLAMLGGALVVAVVIALVAWRATRDGSQEIAALIPDAQPDASVRGGAGGTGASEVTGPGGAGDADDADDAGSADAAVPPNRREAEPTSPKRRDSAATTAKRRGAAAEEAATDLLGEANAKRAAKQWRASDALYARVVQRAPRSLAAQSALVASASLHLEHLRDPKGAARRFRRALALAPSGALAEDARWGIAEAAHASHDSAAERAALDDFLAHHPTSPLAPRAKARRAELP